MQDTSWHPYGNFLAFMAPRADTGWDLMVLPGEGDAATGWTTGTPTVFLETPAQKISTVRDHVVFVSNFFDYLRTIPPIKKFSRADRRRATRPRWQRFRAGVVCGWFRP